MDNTNEYIVQAISVAANNLRLSSEKIETVTILKEHLTKCENLDEEVVKYRR